MVKFPVLVFAIPLFVETTSFNVLKSPLKDKLVVTPCPTEIAEVVPWFPFESKLWTLVISYVFWGIGTPMSWIILTIYFLRMTIHKPLEREVIVSLLLPIGPLGLSGFSYVLHSFDRKFILPEVTDFETD